MEYLERLGDGGFFTGVSLEGTSKGGGDGGGEGCASVDGCAIQFAPPEETLE